ncbi:ABC-2 family transporter protein [Actinokineospora auranticolor]|uniref:ABC-2 type transport system permease protein n=1 Tax=Actinokineospora auranticolor TaxID=155976 RepID=A0A2S6GHE1_9PSEU|nr:ABC-2 family transporter protein [Actinokineospora auranticolor]PPK64620.1 ABC-2 type transport system permease protein [Actinokineospora auranticolor]
MAEFAAKVGIIAHMVRAQVRGQLQYRVSFVMELIGSMMTNALDVATVFVLFSVGGGLGGFGGPNVLLMASLSAVAFSGSDLVVSNVDRLREYVRTGMFDSLLLRPLSSLAQLMAITFALRRVGRFAQAAVLYVIALFVADIDWTVGRVLLAVVAPFTGVVFFSSLFVAGATVAFWWVESGEVANAFTYGGRDFTSYPITMYGGWFRDLFALGLGFGFVAYYPVLALVGLPDPLGVPVWLHWCSPLVAFLAAGLAALFWRVGVRHYRSTGS